MLGLIGAGLLAGSAFGMFMNTPPMYLRRQVMAYFRAVKMQDVQLLKIRPEEYGFRAEIVLPRGKTVTEFRDCLEGLEQATNSKIKFKQLFGATCELKFGTKPFHDHIKYDPELKGPSPLAIPLYTPFGLRWLDFSDETNCHLLSGGATRMGKSVFLRLAATHILRQTEGKVKILFIDNKITDVYMFSDIPQITIAETEEEALRELKLYRDTALNRKNRLKARGKVVDVKQFRKKYPEEEMIPYFIIIDEYGRFAENKDIQEIVIELAETAGYLDFHLIISAQRPDAKDVLKPRIKANIVTRLSFTTSDETNSKIILDMPDAAHLGGIKGRAILLDGMAEVVQVPYISEEQAEEMLKPYERERQEVDPVPKALPGFVSGPVGETDLSGSSPTTRNRKQTRKKTSP